MDKKANAYSRGYEVDFGRGIYGRLANSSTLKKVHGEIWEHLLVRGDSENLILIKRDFKNKKEIIKVHSKELYAIQLKLEKISGLKLSQYRMY